MTRYRQATRKFLILYLSDVGVATVKQMAKDLDKEPRVIQNYLRHFHHDFTPRGSGPNARWQTESVVIRGKVTPRPR